jgi:hypothetical protein
MRNLVAAVAAVVVVVVVIVAAEVCRTTEGVGLVRLLRLISSRRRGRSVKRRGK